MLISLNWLKKYTKLELDSESIAKRVGARLVEVENVLDERGKYDGIYIVQVKSAEKIAGTHLTLCKIDTGGALPELARDENNWVQVMCGAPNVKVNMLAAWIAPGAIVPETRKDKKPLKISMRKMLKKYDSYGMLASPKELDWWDEHEGIVEFSSAEVKAGEKIADAFELDDVILDIENKSLTHRPDTFGVIGFAREVAGIFGQDFHTPKWLLRHEADIKNDAKVADLKIKIEDEKLCARYVAVVMEREGEDTGNYLNKKDTYLARAGMRPGKGKLDEIVDLTNYLMLLTGQPLHAFDYDKFLAVGGKAQAEIGVRAGRAGEKLILLDDKEIALNQDDIVITSGDVPVALAGAMGGKSTAIDQNTKRVILESASFSLYNLRKTQMAHGIFSEAITRFTKGQAPGQTLPVALKYVEMVKGILRPLALFDSGASKNPLPVRLKIAQINQVLGTDFSAQSIQEILQRVELASALNGDELVVTIPFWRMDLKIAEDIIEEVGRLSGYDNIKPVLPLHATADTNPLLELKHKLRGYLATHGANEFLTYSFVPKALMEKVGEDTSKAFKIVNSISPELQYIRMSLVPSLLNKAYQNVRDGYSQFAAFEMNQIYARTFGFDEDGVPKPRHELGFLLINEKPEKDDLEGAEKKSTTSYYQARKYLWGLMKSLRVKAELKLEDGSQKTQKLTEAGAAKTALAPYLLANRSAKIFAGKDELGLIGEIKPSVLAKFKLKQGATAFYLDLEKLLIHEGEEAIIKTTESLSFCDYPAVRRDLTVTVPEDFAYEKVANKIKQIFKSANLVLELEPISIYQEKGKKEKKLTWRLAFANKERTLGKKEIERLMTKVEKGVMLY